MGGRLSVRASGGAGKHASRNSMGENRHSNVTNEAQ